MGGLRKRESPPPVKTDQKGCRKSSPFLLSESLAVFAAGDRSWTNRKNLRESPPRSFPTSFNPLPGEFQAADWVRFSLILPYCFLAFSSVRIWDSSDLLRVSLMPISCTIAPARYIQATRYRILLATSML